jgi:hypothetical protein
MLLSARTPGKPCARPGKPRFGKYPVDARSERSIDAKTQGSPAVFNRVTQLINKGFIAQRAQSLKGKSLKDSVGKVIRLLADHAAAAADAVCSQPRPLFDVAKFRKAAGRAASNDSAEDADLRRFLFTGADANMSPSKESTGAGSGAGSGSGSGVAAMVRCFDVKSRSAHSCVVTSGHYF